MLKTPTILASTALAVALFGSTPLGHAAGRLILPKNSVGSAQIKSAAVTGLKVKDGSLAAADFAPGQLPAGPKGDPGARARRARRGDEGRPGHAGPEGRRRCSRRQRLRDQSSGNTAVSLGGNAGATATCPAGKRVLGGGFTTVRRSCSA